jgi:hypothetical protein
MQREIVPKRPEKYFSYSRIISEEFFFLVLVSWGGVRLSPLGMSATNWPIAPAPDDMSVEQSVE